MTDEQRILAKALEEEALKYMECGLLDEAADIAAVAELIESNAQPWCPVNYAENEFEIALRKAA